MKSQSDLNSTNASRTPARGTVLDPEAPVLAYGTKRSFGAITCTSRRTGMTCKNRRGHGFKVSREHRKVF